MQKGWKAFYAGEALRRKASVLALQSNAGQGHRAPVHRLGSRATGELSLVNMDNLNRDETPNTGSDQTGVCRNPADIFSKHWNFDPLSIREQLTRLVARLGEVTAERSPCGVRIPPRRIRSWAFA
jgi:hypothetical protein